MSGPAYQTVDLAAYRPAYRRVAGEVFRLLQARISAARLPRPKGSYSIVPRSTEQRIAKIVIYQHDRGKRIRPHLWPALSDGVYVLLRANGPAAEVLRESAVILMYPDFSERLDGTRTLAVAPHFDERFHYFPVMAGENLENLAAFLAACAIC